MGGWWLVVVGGSFRGRRQKKLEMFSANWSRTWRKRIVQWSTAGHDRQLIQSLTPPSPPVFQDDHGCNPCSLAPDDCASEWHFIKVFNFWRVQHQGGRLGQSAAEEGMLSVVLGQLGIDSFRTACVYNTVPTTTSLTITMTTDSHKTMT